MFGVLSIFFAWDFRVEFEVPGVDLGVPGVFWGFLGVFWGFQVWFWGPLTPLSLVPGVQGGRGAAEGEIGISRGGSGIKIWGRGGI